MIQTFRKAWGVPELRKKIIFTILILLIFRLGNAIPVPYVNTDLLQNYLDGMSTTVLGLYNVMSGGAFAQATVFALGVQPYINSSIIIQLLTIAIPALERLARDGGEAGKKKIASITRYATVAIALLQGLGYYMLMRNYRILEQSGFWPALVIIVSFVAGSSFVMWLGEQVNEFGIGNGISIILFAGIISRVPVMVQQAAAYIAVRGGVGWLHMLLLLIGILLLVVLIVHVSGAERRIPVQYAKRQVGRKMYGGQASTLPMKVSMSGVLPIIFAQSIASLPATVAAFLPAPAAGSFGESFLNAIDTKSVLYLIVYFLMIIGFSYFYATIQFNPVEISNNLKRQGGFIPGFRPGKPTSDFIAKVLSKVTLFGAIYLGIVAIAPLIVGKAINNNTLAIGGTSVIIVVGVALETVQVLENQMLMRQYKGFLE
ncbi:MAG: preprotein translocase subunit SecY [Oscillospiraceae bacterium]|nr:preprotein translocase subunit SecY [Oscillospiraceae bacterium]